jgi:heme A synthase
VTLAALACFAVLRARPPALDTMVYLLEGALAVRAMLGVGAMVSGRHAVPGTTHIAYLVCSVAILPVMLATLVDDRSRWSAAVIGVACLAILVIAIRLEMTWSTSA